jgi:protein ImuA
MQLITCHRGQLQVLSAEALERGKAFLTGLGALDAVAPGGGFAFGAVHELIGEDERLPMFVAAYLARCAIGENGNVAWCDPHHRLYPPAAAAVGLPLERLYWVRPTKPADVTWAIGECLRCRGVSVTVAQPGKLSRIEARRLQLAAETGGGVGLLLRSSAAASGEFAAATRWLVRSIPGERTVQRWMLQLIHGHGGRVGQGVILEANRETRHVCAFAAVGDRSVEKEVARRRHA